MGPPGRGLFETRPLTTEHTLGVVQFGILKAKALFRRSVILGDSRETVPEYVRSSGGAFDVIFIDGGHDYDVAGSDLEASLALVHQDTVIIMDDTVRSAGLVASYTPGPTRAWDEKVAAGVVQAMGEKEYGAGRGMSWGRKRGSATPSKGA
jgi:hypothetical protein